MFKETTAEDVIKVMRHDNPKLDDAMDELDQLNADLRKTEELIRGALLRYRKDKLKKKSLKKAAEDEFAELEDYPTRESIRDNYGWGMITENEMERLFYLWDLREEQKTRKQSEKYEDGVTKMLMDGLSAIEDKHRDRKEELEEIRDNAMAEARRRATVINGSQRGFLMI